MLKNIVKGWKMYFKDELPSYFKKRATKCMACPHAVDSTIYKIIQGKDVELPGKKCDLCGCALEAKLRVEEEKCPIDKWR